jgi:hypothetical protein
MHLILRVTICNCDDVEELARFSINQLVGGKAERARQLDAACTRLGEDRDDAARRA